MVESFISDTISPLSFGNSGSHDILATAYLKGIIGKLNRALPAGGSARRLMDELLVPLSAAIPKTSQCWQPEVGSVMQRMRAGELEAAVVQALLVMHSLGIAGAWRAELPQSSGFSLGGNFFRAVGWIECEAGNNTISLLDAGGAATSFHLNSGKWEPVGVSDSLGHECRTPHYCRYANFRDIYVHDWKEPEVLREDVVVEWPITTEVQAENQLASSAAVTIDHGLEVLGRAGSGYLHWVRQLFRGVAAAPRRYDDMRQSGSYLDHPGVFNCGFPGAAAKSTAEVIVHEISHQNYLLFNSMFPLCVDFEDDLIYSALKGRPRPLSRVLFAYHAAANMALLWHDLAEKGPLEPYYEKERQTIYLHAQSLASGIAGAKGLTEVGAHFFQFQHAMLVERGIASAN
jgi:HEXXH motif-containing protein